LYLQRSTGRLRSKKNLLLGGGKDREAGGPIMFADVAGVDEAKEELEEIVVSHGYLFFVMYLWVQSLKLLYDLNFFDLSNCLIAIC
jgi:hypothetical protein